MNFHPSGIRLALALLTIPPVALILGILSGAIAFMALDAAQLPLWARVLIASMAVAAVPGILTLIRSAALGVSVSRPLSDEQDEWARRQADAWKRHRAEFEALPGEQIDRVIAIARTAANPQGELTATALELAQSGGFVTLAVRNRSAAPESSHVSSVVVARIADDVGTSYDVALHGMDSWPRGSRVTLAFVPLPPPDAKSVQLTVEKVLVFAEGPPSVLQGPWNFTIPLTG